MLDYGAIGRRIRYYRQKRGFTQEELAFMVRSSASYLSHIERAVKKPSLEKLAEIAEALEISIEELTGCSAPMRERTLPDAVRPVYLCTEEEKEKLIDHLFEIMSILERSS